MEQQRQQQWQEILQLTQQMRELAVPNESLSDLAVDDEYAKQPWHAISELEGSRMALLKAFFSKQVETENAREVAEGINHIQSIDKELFIISQSIQKEIGGVVSKISGAQRAITAYSSNSENQKT